MRRAVPRGAKSARSFLRAVFAVLGLVSLVAWLVGVVTSKHHHPLTYWLVVSLALLLVASLIWGTRRDSPTANAGVHFHSEGGPIIYQATAGTLPPGAPEDPSAGMTQPASPEDQETP